MGIEPEKIACKSHSVLFLDLSSLSYGVFTAEVLNLVSVLQVCIKFRRNDKQIKIGHFQLRKSI